MIIRPEFVTNSVTVLFTALYFFIYRGSIMTAISWGAFQFTTKSHFDFKKVTFSLIILAIIPILLYNVFLESLKFAVLSINSETSWWFYIFIVAMLAFYGSFPKSMKHFWLLIVLHLRKHQRQNALDWLHPSFQKDCSSLPHLIYSIQMTAIVVFGTIGVFIYQLMQGFYSISLGYQYLVKVFTIVYISEILVLASMAAKRQYFYPNKQLKIILYPRTVITIICSILLPVSFGFVYFIICESLISYNWFLFIAWPFPIACSSILHLFARRLHWAPVEQHPEIYSEAPWMWWLGACLIPVCIFLAIRLISTNTKIQFAIENWCRSFSGFFK